MKKYVSPVLDELKLTSAERIAACEVEGSLPPSDIPGSVEPEIDTQDAS